MFFLQTQTYSTWTYARGCPKGNQKTKNEYGAENFPQRREVRGVLIESKAIGSDEVDIYQASKYRVTMIIPFKENPVMNVYPLAKEELNDFLEGYDQCAEFLVSVGQPEAIA